MGKTHARSKQRKQITKDTHSFVSTSSTSTSNISLPSRSRRPPSLKQPDQPCVVPPTTNPNHHHLKKLQEGAICAGRGSNTNTTVRRFVGKNNYNIPPSSPSRKATASLFQPNQKQAAVLSNAAQGHGQSTLPSFSKKVAQDDAVSSNERTVLDNPNLKTHIQPIIHPLVKKKRFKSDDLSLSSSKMSVSELRMDAALGNKKNSLPLDKNERKEDWKTLIDLVADGYVVSDPVDTTNTDSPTSASSNVGKADDLNEACDFSQNQSKCGYFFIIGEVEIQLMYKN